MTFSSVDPKTCFRPKRYYSSQWRYYSKGYYSSQWRNWGGEGVIYSIAQHLGDAKLKSAYYVVIMKC